MIRLAIIGSLGRMGQSIYRFAKEDKDFDIVALLEKKDHPDIGKVVDGIDVTSHLDDLKNADILIDFTLPESTMTNVSFCAENNIKMVIGTTGLSESGIKTYEDVMFLKSLGVNCVLIGETFMDAEDIAAKVREVMRY